MMTTSLSGDLSHTPRPAFYITDTDLGGRVGQVSHGCGVVCNLTCVCAEERISSPLLLSGVHMGRFNKGPR